MNAAIELHDSECLAIVAERDGNGFVLLEAYVHRSDGRPGVDKGEGGIQLFRLAFENMTVHGEVGNLPADIYAGSLTTGDAVADNLIALPGSYAGSVRFTIAFSDDARSVTVSGTKLTLMADSEFRYVEPFN